MSQFRLVVSPERRQSILELLGKRHAFEVVLSSSGPGWRLSHVHLSPRLEDLFQQGSYGEIILSVGALPHGEKDGHYLARECQDLVEIKGGRCREALLELSTVRLMSKTDSNARPVYSALRRAVSKSCSKGLTTTTGVRYENIFYDESVRGYELREQIDDDFIVYRNPYR